MVWEAWLVVGMIVLVLGVLMSNRVGPDIVLVGAVTVLVVVDIVVPGADILTTREALNGMANEGMLTVAIMYVVVCGLKETGGIAWLGQRVLGQPKTLLGAQLRMMLPVTTLSAFLNNTPLVAMFIPVIQDWCKRQGFSPSKLMIPLSYAAILGGTCTLIGTSTNLVVAGLWADHFAGARDRIGFFEIAKVGVPAATIGLAYLLFTSRFFLPDRGGALDFGKNPRAYTAEMEVEEGSPLIGKTIEQAGLRHLPGLYLAEIERGGQLLPAVGPDEKLFADDRLVFVGVVDSIVELQKLRGLRPATNQVVKLDAPRPQRCLLEAVVSNTSPLVGRSVREGRFRTVYNAVVIAVARNGERITNRKIGDIVLRTGDTLLLEANKSFQEQHRNSRDFFLVSAVENSTRPRHEKALIAVGIMTFMILTATFGGPLGFGMIHAAALAAGLMLFTRCCTGAQARGSVDWQVLVVIASGFALGRALETTGAADVIAAQMIALAGGNVWFTLALVYLTAMIFTELITNNAAATLLFPIAMGAAERLGADPLPFAISIMMAASACFATPIGYQTNLMVMSPGGYKFSDYMRMGIPMNLFMAAITITLVPLIWPLMPA
jgi:di/tricarboxylate transporter